MDRGRFPGTGSQQGKHIRHDAGKVAAGKGRGGDGETQAFNRFLRHQDALQRIVRPDAGKPPCLLVGGEQLRLADLGSLGALRDGVDDGEPGGVGNLGIRFQAET